MRPRRFLYLLDETKHWRGKPLVVNNGLPLQCFVCSEPSDAPARRARTAAVKLRGRSITDAKQSMPRNPESSKIWFENTSRLQLTKWDSRNMMLNCILKTKENTSINIKLVSKQVHNLGGWGSLPLEAVPDAQKSPPEKHPKGGFHGISKDTLWRSHRPTSTS